jgi:hypothetical protein
MDTDNHSATQRPSMSHDHTRQQTSFPTLPSNPTTKPFISDSTSTTGTGTVFTSGNSTAGNESHHKSSYTQPSPSTPINDGTFRLTVRWKPVNYDDIYANQARWDETITDTLADVFGAYIDNINLIKWDDISPMHTRAFGHIKEIGDIRKFISPRITHLESLRQFFFGLRISMGDSTPSRWINDRLTKRTMQDNSITISISNSKTNSGDVVTAGHILLKHPDFTHRTYYLMSLRRSLPETTPDRKSVV